MGTKGFFPGGKAARA